MTRLATLIVAALVLFACNKPTTENCRLALANMRRLLGTDNLHDDAALEGEVRRCKGGSTRKSVDCAIKAQTLEDLKSCNFYKGPLPAPTPGPAPAPGSAAAGSAAAGSGAGAAAPGSAAGSGAGAAAAPAGSAAGTTAGSAVGSGSG